MSRFEEVVNEAIDEVILGEAFKAETLAAHIAERVRDRQDGRRAEVTIAARYPEHKRAPASEAPTQEIYTLFGSAVAAAARHPPPDRRRGPGHDRLPLRAGAGDGALAGAPARRRLHRRRDRRACSTPCRWPPTTSAGSARCTWAAPRAATSRVEAETLLEIVESAMSSEIYELMKRPDEVEVVEKAHMRPRFVEDCVREMIRMAVERFAAPGRGRLPAQPARRTWRPSTSTTSWPSATGCSASSPTRSSRASGRATTRARASGSRPLRRLALLHGRLRDHALGRVRRAAGAVGDEAQQRVLARLQLQLDVLGRAAVDHAGALRSPRS